MGGEGESIRANALQGLREKASTQGIVVPREWHGIIEINRPVWSIPKAQGQSRLWGRKTRTNEKKNMARNALMTTAEFLKYQETVFFPLKYIILCAFLTLLSWQSTRVTTQNCRLHTFPGERVLLAYLVGLIIYILFFLLKIGTRLLII